MNECALTQLLVVGLPATGKTTFLAALWHVAESAEIRCSLVVSRYHGDREYLNKIRDEWLEYRQLPRTGLVDEQSVSMRLVRRAGGSEVEVVFPDMSGESFKLQWTDRRWSVEYSRLVSQAAGVLLFVHPDEVVEPTRIDQANRLVAELPEVPEPPTDAEFEESVEWDPSQAPTQVQLVELLQFISDHAAEKRFRIGVIVSAWDLVRDNGVAPEEWVGQRLPLLSQYLRANSDDYPYRVFGVSAQGGDLQRDSARLRKCIRPSDRVGVTGLDCATHDLTAVVGWVMGGSLAAGVQSR